jgi:hypothetical protein
MGPYQTEFDIKSADRINSLFVDMNETADSFENLIRKPVENNMSNFTPIYSEPVNLLPNPDRPGSMMPTPNSK